MRRVLAMAGIATLLPWSAGIALTASVAQAASATGASFTGGAGTRVVNGTLFADPGAALTLNVTTDNETKCVEITGAHTATKKADNGTTQWSFPLTANATNGVHTITATAFKKFNNNKCNGDAGESFGPQTASYTVESDSTAPVVTAAVSPAANAAGWHKDPVSITWSATDFGSGVAAGFPSPASDSVTAETPAAGVNKTSIAKDNAGNTGTGSVTVRLDKTAPTVTASADRAANGAGWYNGDVTVSFPANDALSGIDKAPAAKVLGEGANQSATGTATDVAGNQGSATLSGINVDKTAPTLSAAATTSPNAAGWYNGPVTVKWTAADALSGLAAPAPADTVLSTEGADQTVTKTVADKAGNTTSAASPAIKHRRHRAEHQRRRAERLEGTPTRRSRSSRTTACRASRRPSTSSTATRRRAARTSPSPATARTRSSTGASTTPATRRRTRPSRSRSTAPRRRSRTR